MQPTSCPFHVVRPGTEREFLLYAIGLAIVLNQYRTASQANLLKDFVWIGQELVEINMQRFMRHTGLTSPHGSG